MHLKTYDYAILRLVPRVDRGEFINVGVILSCSSNNFLAARFNVNKEKIHAIDPDFDLESIRTNLEAVKLICKGGPEAGHLGTLSVRERFHWLTAPRSSSLQTSPVHTGRCNNLDEALDKIFETMVGSAKA